MRQCTFITGTDRNIILSMSTFFENLNQRYTILNLFDKHNSQDNDPKLHSLSTSLIDLHLNSHKNNDTNTIFLCFRSPEIPLLENINDILFSNYFNIELFFAVKLLVKSFFFLSNKKSLSDRDTQDNTEKNTIQKNIYVVLPQINKSISSEKNIFIQMLIHSCIQFSKHIITKSKYPLTLTLLQYHYNISFPTKMSMIQNYIKKTLHIGKIKKNSLIHSFTTTWTKLIKFILKNKQETSQLIIKYNKLPLIKKNNNKKRG